MHFQHIWLIWLHLHFRTIAQGIVKFTNLVDSSLVINIMYFVWIIQQSREEDLKKKCIFTIWIIWLHACTPQHKNTCHRGHEIYNFGRLFLGYHYYILSLCESCPGLEKKNTSISKFLHQNYLPLWGRACNSLSLCSIDATYQIRFRLAQMSFRRRC